MSDSAQPVKIVVVEDDADQVELLRDQFADLKHAWELQSFPSGEAVIDYLDSLISDLSEKPNDLPDLIILDLFLPGEDGMQVLKSIKSRPFIKDIPVAMLSNSREPAHLTESYHKGSVMFIRKPASSKTWRDLFVQLRMAGYLKK